MSRLIVLIVNQRPFSPDAHVSATLRNLNIQSDSVELIANPDYQEMVTLQTTVAMAARKHGFEADFTRCVCTPYSSSDGVKGIAVQVSGGTDIKAERNNSEGNHPGKEGKCFIATAAYGTADAPAVLVLREFRDRKLRPLAAGRFFITWYERFSPPIAGAVSIRPNLRFLVRKLLLVPLCRIAQRSLRKTGENTPGLREGKE